MAWQLPRFGITHAARDAGAAGVSVLDTIATGYKAYVHDGRRDLVIFTNSLATHYVQIDRGAAGLAELERLVIPFGHNLNGSNVRVRADTAATFSGTEVTILASTAVTSTALVDLAMTGGTAAQRQRRYVRLDFPSSTFIPQLTEVWLTETLEPTVGPKPEWGDTPKVNAESFVKPSGDRADLSLGASQRVFTLDYPHVVLAADITKLDALLDLGTTEPFLFDPPFDDEAVLICKMASVPRRDFDTAVPASTGKAYRYRFEIIEQLG